MFFDPYYLLQYYNWAFFFFLFCRIVIYRETLLVSGKKKGLVFVNSRWYNLGHVKEIICTPDMEQMAMGLRPYYLPCEFSHATVLIYIPPSAMAAQANYIFHCTIARLQTQHPSVVMIINGDFNHIFQGKIKSWTCWMPMWRSHNAPLPSFPWWIRPQTVASCTLVQVCTHTAISHH